MLAPGAPLDAPSKYQKNLSFHSWERKMSFYKTYQGVLCLLTRPALKRNCFIQLIGPNLLGFYHSLINLGEGKYSIPPTLDILFHQRGEKTENHICNSQPRGTDSLTAQVLVTGVQNAYPAPHTLPHNTKGLFTRIPFTQYITSSFQQQQKK